MNSILTTFLDKKIIRKELVQIPDNSNDRPSRPGRFITSEQMNLINRFRFNNIDHAQMLRLMISSHVDSTPCADTAFSRMTDVSYRVYLALLNYYSAELSEEMYNIIAQNFILIRNLTTALKEKNQEATTAALRLLNENSNRIAELYNRMNPYWSESRWQNLMNRYIRLVYLAIFNLIGRNCELAYDIFDRIVAALMITMGDYMAEGIIWSLNVDGIEPIEQVQIPVL